MIIGLLKESKPQEFRVALTPHHIASLVKRGHQVLVQKNAGVGAGYANHVYQKAGAHLLTHTFQIIEASELLIKVKEPNLSEVALMKPSQMILCYLHLAAYPRLLKKILRQKIIALGYETLQLSNGQLPLLKPMSEIAGKLATQNGAHLLRADQGGRGVLLGGTTQVQPGLVVILGAGVVGENACKIAVGLGAQTIVFDVDEKKHKKIKKEHGPKISTFLSNKKKIAEVLRKADLVIGAALIPGARAPKLVTQKMVQTMQKGSVIVDVAVDQGGCIETSVVTSHEKPFVKRYGVLHYGVPNMPGVVPVTSTLALTTETYPYIERLADWGLDEAMKRFPEIQGMINCAGGKIIHKAIK